MIAFIPVSFGRYLGSLAPFLFIFYFYFVFFLAITNSKRKLLVLGLIIIPSILTTIFWRSNELRRIEDVSLFREPMPSNCPPSALFEGIFAGPPTKYYSAIHCWYEATKDNNDDAVMVLVATAGGGIRAADWTTTVLSYLDTAIPNFNQHLFAVSGVSGGAVGAILYKAALLERKKGRNCKSSNEISDCLRRIIKQDHLAPVIAAWMTGDLISSFIGPLSTLLGDRADAFEQGWEYSWHEVYGSDLLNVPFPKLWPEKPWPAVIATTTNLDTGSPFFISNLHEIGGSWARNEIFSTFYRASTIASLSARFPFVTPPARLTTRMSVENSTLLNPVRNIDDFVNENQGWVTVPPYRLATESILGVKPAELRFQGVFVDGGYSDNFGASAINILMDLVDEYQCDRIMRLESTITANNSCQFILERKRFIRFIVIQITSDPNLDTISSSECTEPPRPDFRTIKRTDPPSSLIPFLALDSFRQFSGILSAAKLEELVSDRVHRDKYDLVDAPYVTSGPKALTSSYFHFPIKSTRSSGTSREVPLHWVISEASRATIESSIASCPADVLEDLSGAISHGLRLSDEDKANFLNIRATRDYPKVLYKTTP